MSPAPAAVAHFLSIFFRFPPACQVGDDYVSCTFWGFSGFNFQMCHLPVMWQFLSILNRSLCADPDPQGHHRHLCDAAASYGSPLEPRCCALTGGIRGYSRDPAVCASLCSENRVST